MQGCGHAGKAALVLSAGALGALAGLQARDNRYVWRARAWAGPLVLHAVDHYLDGAGRMRIALWELVPLVRATGPDLTRSARERFVAECVALPSALLPGLHVRIEGLDAARFRVAVTVHGETTPLTLTVAPDGRLEEVTLERWGNLTPDGAYRAIPYGVRASGEGTFGGYTIPTELAGGWWYGTARYQEGLRVRVAWARLE